MPRSDNHVTQEPSNGLQSNHVTPVVVDLTSRESRDQARVRQMNKTLTFNQYSKTL